MKLKDWLDQQGMSATTFAALAGVSNKRPSDWMAGRISAQIAARIQVLTRGCVTALDFFPEEKSFAKAAPVSRRANFKPEEESEATR